MLKRLEGDWVVVYEESESKGIDVVAAIRLGRHDDTIVF